MGVLLWIAFAAFITFAIIPDVVDLPLWQAALAVALVSVGLWYWGKRLALPPDGHGGGGRDIDAT